MMMFVPPRVAAIKPRGAFFVYILWRNKTSPKVAYGTAKCTDL